MVLWSNFLKWKWLLFLAISLLLFFGFFLYQYSLLQNQKTPSEEQLSALQNKVRILKPTQADHILGDISAPILLIEYSDTECKFCKKFYPILENIVADYSPKVALVYRHFALGIFERSYFEFQATECAYEQAGDTTFFRYLRELYEITPGEDGLDPKELTLIAQRLGLDSEIFTSCLKANRNREKLNTHQGSGAVLNTRPVPHTYVLVPRKGYFYEFVGSGQEAAIRAVIETEIE